MTDWRGIMRGVSESGIRTKTTILPLINLQRTPHAADKRYATRLAGQQSSNVRCVLWLTDHARVVEPLGDESTHAGPRVPSHHTIRHSSVELKGPTVGECVVGVNALFSPLENRNDRSRVNGNGKWRNQAPVPPCAVTPHCNRLDLPGSLRVGPASDTVGVRVRSSPPV
jgi:hypothetical protein